MFGDALIGRSILAPVDIAPALWARFGHVDPQSNGIPTNHHIVDQLSYDLPMQWSIYHSYRRGEVPWWDPYTLCGRPLLADAHANAADPVRVLLYLTIPDFVLAYNWTLVVHHMVLGLGMFVLLRRFGSSIAVSTGLALAFQMGGTFLIFFGHPWVTASFEWYPWLWAAWHTAWERNRWWSCSATLAVAAIFFSGNLQSHAYLPVFGLCFAAGYCGASLQRWKGAILLLGTSGMLGALIAAPVLGPELELFLNRGQGRGIGNTGGEPWHGVLAAAAVWPWALGTFRTVGLAECSFHLFVGVAVPFLSILGGWKSKSENLIAGHVRRAAIWCVVAVVVATCTPLIHVFYMRISGIAVMGMVTLAALGCVRLCELSGASRRRLSLGVTAFAALTAVGTAVVAYVVFPVLQSRIRERMIAHAETDAYLGMGAKMRLFQVENFPAEVGFLNPEVALGLLTLLALAMVLKRPVWLPLLMVLNAASPALFARRFIPSPPVACWARLVAGSEEQRSLASLVRTRRLRQGKAFDRQFGRYFPMQTAHFFGVHIFDGYTALGPAVYALSPEINPILASDFWTSDGGTTDVTNKTGNARFQWIDRPTEAVVVESLGLNRVKISFDRRSGGELLRTDTFYPGWQAIANDGRVCEGHQRGVFSDYKIPAGVGAVVFRYLPSNMPYLLGVCAGAFVTVACLALRCAFTARVGGGKELDEDVFR